MPTHTQSTIDPGHSVTQSSSTTVVPLPSPMKPKFSIFRCPQVVVSIIFKIADPQDLVAVAFCSKRAFKLVKALSPNSKRLQLDLDCVNRVALLRYRGETHQLIRVPYQVGELEYGRKSTRIMFCKQAVQIKAFENGTWIMSFEGAWPSDGFRLVIRWLWKLFSINVTKMWVDGNTVDFVDFLESRQNGLETLVVRTDRSLRQEDYCSMLECRARQVIFDDLVIARMNSQVTTNGSSRASRIYSYGFEAESPWSKTPHLLNPFNPKIRSWTEHIHYMDIATDICKIGLSDPGLHEFIGSQKYDIGIATEYDYCGFALMKKYSIPSTVSVSSMAILDQQSMNAGMPNSAAVVPAIFENEDLSTWSGKISNFINWAHINFIVYPYCKKHQLATIRQYLGDDTVTIEELMETIDVQFVNSNELIELPRAIGPKFKYIGGINLKMSNDRKLSQEVEETIGDVNKGIVVFCFGTQVHSNQFPIEVRKAFAEAFRLFPDYTFIWKYDLQEDDPRTKAFISHTGLNSFVEASYAGVPILAIPLFVDQPHNAESGRSIGTTFVLDKTRLTRDTIVDGLRAVLYDEKYSLNAKRISKMLHERPSSPESIFVEWVEFAARNPLLHRNFNLAGRNMTVFEYYCIDIILMIVVFVVSVVIVAWKMGGAVKKTENGRHIRVDGSSDDIEKAMLAARFAIRKLGLARWAGRKIEELAGNMQIQTVYVLGNGHFDAEKEPGAHQLAFFIEISEIFGAELVFQEPVCSEVENQWLRSKKIQIRESVDTDFEFPEEICVFGMIHGEHEILNQILDEKWAEPRKIDNLIVIGNDYGGVTWQLSNMISSLAMEFGALRLACSSKVLISARNLPARGTKPLPRHLWDMADLEEKSGGQLTHKPLRINRLGGRDPETGRKVNQHIGGGVKFDYFMIDFHRRGPTEAGATYDERVLEVRRDPNRTCHIALCAGIQGKRWILATENMKAGDVISTSGHLAENPVIGVEGNAYPIGSLAAGTVINSIERYPTKDSETFVKAAGTSATVIRHQGEYTVVKLPHKHEFSLHRTCMATVGRLSHADIDGKIFGSAQMHRRFGYKMSSGLFHKKDGYFGRKSNSTSLFFYYPGVLPKRDSLIVEDGHWLSNYHLMTSDIKHLEIGNSTLTENDLNQFLRHWLDGGSYRIKLLTVKMRRLKWEVVLAGLYDRFVQLPKDKAVVYRGPVHIRQNLSNVRFYFRRGDGIISTINWDHYSDNFHFAVWPDANGQIIV
uniref:glucuronosyltransferase n=1 Tax=Caenorhabditis tropicalis TaxID=1561998 RepID=A0A1I7UZ36_9PELO